MYRRLFISILPRLAYDSFLPGLSQHKYLKDTLGTYIILVNKVKSRNLTLRQSNRSKGFKEYFGGTDYPSLKYNMTNLILFLIK